MEAADWLAKPGEIRLWALADPALEAWVDALRGQRWPPSRSRRKHAFSEDVNNKSVKEAKWGKGYVLRQLHLLNDESDNQAALPMVAEKLPPKVHPLGVLSSRLGCYVISVSRARGGRARIKYSVPKRSTRSDVGMSSG
jgi:hypothetical protein